MPALEESLEGVEGYVIGLRVAGRLSVGQLAPVLDEVEGEALGLAELALDEFGRLIHTHGFKVMRVGFVDDGPYPSSLVLHCILYRLSRDVALAVQVRLVADEACSEVSCLPVLGYPDAEEIGSVLLPLMGKQNDVGCDCHGFAVLDDCFANILIVKQMQHSLTYLSR